MSMRHVLSSLVAIALCGRALHAQIPTGIPTGTSVLVGRVLDARSERIVVGAQVLLPSLERETRSDSLGRFRVTGLPAGQYRALVRAVGFDSLVFAVDVADADTAEADAMLMPNAQTLAKVRIEATGGLFAARMAEFEDRKKMGFGKFLDSTVFGDGRRRPIADVLMQRLAGISIEKPRGSGAFLAGRRGRNRMSTAPCFAQVIVDGINLGSYDLSLIDPDEVVAMEFHTIATAPLKYRNTSIGVGGSATCGTLIVWRK